MNDEKLDWTDFGIYEPHDLPTDWQHVLSISDGAGYEWSEFYAFYSPTARRFFWSGGSGCSCSGWGDDLKRETDFENGSKADLERAARDFLDDNSYDFTPADGIAAMETLRRWRKP